MENVGVGVVSGVGVDVGMMEKLGCTMGKLGCKMGHHHPSTPSHTPGKMACKLGKLACKLHTRETLAHPTRPSYFSKCLYFSSFPLFAGEVLDGVSSRARVSARAKASNTVLEPFQHVHII